MKLLPFVAKGVSRSGRVKFARRRLCRLARRRRAPDHYLMYAFRETMIGMGSSGTLPGGAT